MEHATPSTLAQVYLNRRMAALLGLGFAAGLPSAYSLLGSTLQAWLGDYGVSVEHVGLATLIGLPLAFNFVWAPLMDRYVPRVVPGMGRRRSWLLVVQSLLIVAIAALAWAGPTHAGSPLAPLIVLGLVVAFLVASQDVVADAYRTDVLPDRELGAGAAVFVNGYRVGMLAAGAGVLLLVGWLKGQGVEAPWRIAYLAMAALMGVGLVATLLAPDPPRQSPPATLQDAVVQPMADFWRRMGWGLLAVLAFVVLFRLPDAMARPMVMPLLQDLGFTESQIGLLRETPTLPAMVLGALLGGLVLAKMRLVPALWLFGALQAVSNLGFLALAWTGRSEGMLLAVASVEALCGGLVTAGFIAFLMSRCNRRYSATQYALFTSVMYAGGLIVGSMTGYMVRWLGHDFGWFFLASALSGLPGMALLLWVGATMARPATEAREGYCRACGYDLRGGFASAGSACPECGSTVGEAGSTDAAADARAPQVAGA